MYIDSKKQVMYVQCPMCLYNKLYSFNWQNSILTNINFLVKTKTHKKPCFTSFKKEMDIDSIILY